MGDAYTIAFKLLTLGFSVIPSGGGDKGKAPLVNWRDYQTTAPDESQLEAWERELTPVLWGIVTNNHLAAIDADTPDARAAIEAKLGEPHVTTPRGGAHWYIDTAGHPVKTMAGLLPGIDVRGVGGFVNIAGGKYRILRLPVPGDTLIPWDKLPKSILKALNGSKPRWAAPQGTPIPDTTRNATLTSLGGTMRRRGMSKEAIEAALREVNRQQCQPPLLEEEVKAIATSVSRYVPDNDNNHEGIYTNRTKKSEHERDKNGTENRTTSLHGNSGELSRFEGLSKRVRAWVQDTVGWWTTEELDKELGVTDHRGKENRRKIILRLRGDGIIEGHPKINKQFRYVNTRITSLAFKTASNAGVLPIKWPLGIEKYVNLFPGNIAVVAGSPNAGKTALLLNFIHLNQEAFPVYYFCSEMGAVELRDRLDKFPGMDVNDWKFEAIERAGDFADVIRPDCVNVIDYLEMTTELYLINTHLTAISHKVGNGLAIVAIQKKQGAQYGRGQEFGVEKPKLYLSMDKGKLQIVKGKSWATKKINPNGLQVSFKIIGGCQFQATSEWDWVK